MAEAQRLVEEAKAAEVAEARRDAEARVSAATEARADAEAAKAAVQEQLDASRAEATARHEAVAKAEAELEAQRRKVAEQEAAAAAAKAQLDAIRERLTATEEAKKTVEARRAALEDELQQARIDLAQFEGGAADADNGAAAGAPSPTKRPLGKKAKEIIDGYKTRITELEGQLQAEGEKSRAAAEETTQLKAQLAEATKKAEASQKLVEEKEGALVDLRGKMQEAEQAKRAAEARVAEVEAELAESAERVAELTEETDVAAEEIKHNKKTIAAAEARATELEEAQRAAEAKAAEDLAAAQRAAEEAKAEAVRQAEEAAEARVAEVEEAKAEAVRKAKEAAAARVAEVEAEKAGLLRQLAAAQEAEERARTAEAAKVAAEEGQEAMLEGVRAAVTVFVNSKFGGAVRDANVDGVEDVHVLADLMKFVLGQATKYQIVSEEATNALAQLRARAEGEEGAAAAAAGGSPARPSTLDGEVGAAPDGYSPAVLSPRRSRDGSPKGLKAALPAQSVDALLKARLEELRATEGLSATRSKALGSVLGLLNAQPQHSEVVDWSAVPRGGASPARPTGDPEGDGDGTSA